MASFTFIVHREEGGGFYAETDHDRDHVALFGAGDTREELENDCRAAVEAFLSVDVRYRPQRIEFDWSHV